RFYFMEKSGWEKFVRDNALGRNELLCFTHKGKMNFSVNIMMQIGKEMLQPPQARDFLASSSKSLLKLNKMDLMEEACTKRKLNFGEKKAEESQNTQRSERAFSIGRDCVVCMFSR
ncbi:PREDICTED: B3 domain-containing protein At2g35310-like, partial [Camelina sativa]|uniref:B3 domain-containing protein At2g35310-like n=1 Tax=Camelina sativa TaxID=90675 RepID=A0ABM1QC85_CAMSA